MRCGLLEQISDLLPQFLAGVQMSRQGEEHGSFFVFLLFLYKLPQSHQLYHRSCPEDEKGRGIQGTS
jgi:hypothetical protein